MRTRAVLWGAVALLLFGPPARAATSRGSSDHADVTLLTEHASIRPGEPFRVALRLELEKGWHTYWKQPGDAGLPLRIEWMLPAGFSAGPIEWPTPERIKAGDLMSYGYEGEVLLPVTITPPATIAADSILVSGTFDWLECKDVCVAGSATLGLRLPVRPDPPENGPAAMLFAAARARLPRRPVGWALSAVAGPRAIEISFRPPRGVQPEGGYFFVDEPLVVEHAAPQTFERGDAELRLRLVSAENAPSPPRRLSGVLVLDGVPEAAGNSFAVDIPVAAGTLAPAADSRPAWSGGWLVAILGVAAGLAVAMTFRRRFSPPIRRRP